MKKRKMFFRMITASLMRRRSLLLFLFCGCFRLWLFLFHGNEAFFTDPAFRRNGADAEP